MKRALLSIAFITLTVLVSSQSENHILKNKFTIGLNGSFLSSGDRWGFHYNNVYQRCIANKLGLGINTGMLYSVKESTIVLEIPDYEDNLITGDWIFTTEDGIKILKMKTDQQIFIHSDIFLSYPVLKIKRFVLDITAGGSVSYISNSYLTRWELGTFNGMSGTQNLQLYYPYYSRLIDLGICSKINLEYEINGKMFVGMTAGINHYFKSAYRFYDLGIMGGLRF